MFFSIKTSSKKSDFLKNIQSKKTPSCESKTVFFVLCIRSLPLRQSRRRKRRCSSNTVMVEARGIEPLSESPFTQTSPGAECCLNFPKGADSIQTAPSGIFLIQRRYGKSSRRSFTANRRPVRSCGTQRQNGCLIKQQKQIC